MMLWFVWFLALAVAALRGPRIAAVPRDPVTV
jgi:hypothetical protein